MLSIKVKILCDIFTYRYSIDFNLTYFEILTYTCRLFTVASRPYKSPSKCNVHHADTTVARLHPNIRRVTPVLLSSLRPVRRGSSFTSINKFRTRQCSSWKDACNMAS